MFDFEKFTVYIKSEEYYKIVLQEVLSKKINNTIRDQLHRASSSIVLNIAEGSGKYSKADKKNYYLIARGSVHECVALIKIYTSLEEISKMLSGLISRFVTTSPSQT